MQLQSQLLNQRAAAASVQAEFRTAELQLEADQEIRVPPLAFDTRPTEPLRGVRGADLYRALGSAVLEIV